jgi:phosphopantetheinyl transferase
MPPPVSSERQPAAATAGPHLEDVETCAIIAVGSARSVEATEVLDNVERMKHRSLNGRRADEWLAGRIALKLAYARQLSVAVPLSSVHTWADRFDRPWVARNRDRRHCSLSHGGEVAAAVVATDRVGVDVERSRVLSESLLEYVASPQDIAYLRRATPPHVAGIRLWTIKEAVLKALGEGFRLPAKSAEVEWANGHSARVVTSDREGKRATWAVGTHFVAGAVLSIAHVDGTSACAVELHWITRDDVQAACRVPRSAAAAGGGRTGER